MKTDKDRQLHQEKAQTNASIKPQNHHDIQYDQNNHQNNQIFEQVHNSDSEMQDESQQYISNQQQPSGDGDNDYDYDQYYDQEEEYMVQESYCNFERIKSTEKNTQCTMEHLINIIEKEVKTVMQLTGFDREWAFLLYYMCGWKMVNVENVIDQKLTSHRIVNYKPSKAQISTLEGECIVCCSKYKILLKNSCGDEFCLTCWRQSLKEKMEENYMNPFPPCLNENCKRQAFPFILGALSLNDESFKKLYLKTLCRSYAYGNKSVKICKGREKKSCYQCFKVNNLSEKLQCENCGNILCSKCGQDYHSPSFCFEQTNFRKIVQNSTNFIEILDYKFCPNCKQAVEKSTGCNSVICKCTQMFCYICGQKWAPNHSKHGICYRSEEIQALKKERNKKVNNDKEYTRKLQKQKEKIDTLNFKIKKIQDIDVKNVRGQIMKTFKILSNELDYIEPLVKMLKTAFMAAKGYAVSLYFQDNMIKSAQEQTLSIHTQKVYDFLIYELPFLIEAFSDKPLVSKKAYEIRKENINPHQKLARAKIQMLQSMNNLQKYINQ